MSESHQKNEPDSLRIKHLNVNLATPNNRNRHSIINLRMESEQVREEDEASLQTERVFEDDHETAREKNIEDLTFKDVALLKSHQNEESKD